MERLYLDHNATSPVRPEVREAMAESLHFTGNPSAVHREGAIARLQLERARRSLSRSLGVANPECIVFTSGASEANTLALIGAASLACSNVEHVAVLATHEAPTLIPCDAEGRVVGLPQFSGGVVSVMLANNEIGTINPVERLTAEAREQGLLFHSDAVQGVGRIPLELDRWGVDFVTLAGHKIGGPRGIGALFVREELDVAPLIRGGGQERGRRAGTENVAGAVGFARAVALAVEEIPEQVARWVRLREEIWDRLTAQCPGVLRNSPREGCLANTLNVSFPGRDGRELARHLDDAGIAVSTGSACAAGGGRTLSHVLLAMGLPEERVAGALRITLGHDTPENAPSRLVDSLQRILHG